MLAQRGQHQRLAGTGKDLADQILQQARLQTFLLHGRRIQLWTHAFVTAQQTLAMHQLQLAQHGGVAGVVAFKHQRFMNGPGVGRADTPEDAQQVQLGCGGMGDGRLSRHASRITVLELFI